MTCCRKLFVRQHHQNRSVLVVCVCVGCVLTVDNDLDHSEVDLTTGQDSSLAGVHALVCLFDAANLKAVGRMGEPH